MPQVKSYPLPPRLEMKQLELKKYDFYYRSMSRLMALSDISGPLRFHYAEKNSNLEWNNPTQLKKFRLRYSTKNQADYFGETTV